MFVYTETERQAHFYKLLVYEPGDFFRTHVDSKRAAEHLLTLVVDCGFGPPTEQLRRVGFRQYRRILLQVKALRAQLEEIRLLERFFFGLQFTFLKYKPMKLS